MKLFPRKGFDIKDYIDEFRVGLKITKDTKIISLGSCFAREIKNYLINDNYNYLVGETEKDCWVNEYLFPGDQGKHKSSHGSIAWERVYHTHTFNQIVKYSFDGFDSERLYKFAYKGKDYFADLLRTRVVYDNYKTAINDIKDHIKMSWKMFIDAELLIFTLGLTEVWRYKDKVLGSLFSGIDIDKKFYTTGYEENYNMLKDAIGILKDNNRNLKILITVSPVHLLATYRDDLDCVSASCASKSILRAVADEITKIDGCYYFPSYEIANILYPLIGKYVYPLNHHVSNDVVEFIMYSFFKNCIK